MRSYLDFEKPVAELDSKVDELRALGVGRHRHRRGSVADRGKGVAGAGRSLRQSDALAEDAGRAPSAAAAFHRLHQRPDHRIHAARRRPQVRRGRGPARRLRPLPRRADLRDGPGKGRLDRIAHQAQFRHGAPGGLPQGGPADGDWPSASASRCCRSSIPPAPIPASARRNADRRRRSRARPTPASRSASPNVAIITGEGMSGGAIAITTANRVLMLEHAIYSVISPEAASSILWRDGTKAQEAANSMKITAQDMLRFGVIDTHPEGAGRRRPSRSRRHDRRDRRGHRTGLRRIARPRPRRDSQAAATEIPRHRPEIGLSHGF